VLEFPEKWTVVFVDKSLAGDSMTVTKNKETGEVQYFQGE